MLLGPLVLRVPLSGPRDACLTRRALSSFQLRFPILTLSEARRLGRASACNATSTRGPSGSVGPQMSQVVFGKAVGEAKVIAESS